MRKEIKIPTEGDQTALLRELIENPEVTELQVMNDENEHILAEGRLPLDEREFPRWSIGEYGIVRIEDRSSLKIKGNGTTIYVNDSAVPILPVGTDPSHWDRSLRRFFEIVVSENITIMGVGGKSNNIKTDGDKPGFPLYIEEREFEHFARIFNSKRIKLINCFGENLWGDGIYISGNDTEDVLIDKFILNGTGRQGTTIAGGKNIVLSRIQVLRSRRGGLVDIEAPLTYQITDGVVVRSSFCKSALLAFPMAGSGIVNNVLIRDNYYSSSGGTSVRATIGRGSKKNYIFKGNTSLMQDGGYAFTNVENILIEDEWQRRKPTKEVVFSFINCKNITVRNNDIRRVRQDYGTGIQIALIGTTTPSDVKVYGNAEDIYFNYNGELVKAEEYVPTEEERNNIPFEVSDFLYEQYHSDRVKVNFLPEVNEFIQSIVPGFTPDELIEEEEQEPPVTPDPITPVETEPIDPEEEYPTNPPNPTEPTPPIEEEPTPEQPEIPEEPIEPEQPPVVVEPIEPELPVEPETPIEEDSEVDAGFPEKDKEESKETPETEKVEKAWYKNKILWIIVGVILITIIILI